MKREVRVLLGWAEELRALQRFGLADGMRILDLGSGQGVISAELLRKFPAASVVGVDSRPLARGMERTLVQPFAARSAVLTGEAQHLPLRDSTMDFAVARLVFQYLESPVEAACGVLRVLRPRCRLVITDVDRSLSFAVQPELPELNLVMARYDQWHRARGGDRGIGARLGEVLREAGADPVELETIRFESRPETAEMYLDALVGPRRIQGLLNEGYLGQTEVNDFVEARARWLVSPDRAIMRYLRMACGTRPL